LNKIISLDARSNIIKDVTNVRNEIAKLDPRHDKESGFVDIANALEGASAADPPLPAAGVIAYILKSNPDLIPANIQKNAFEGDTNSKDAGAIKARRGANDWEQRIAARAALGVRQSDFVLESKKLKKKAPKELLKRAGVKIKVPTEEHKDMTKAFAEHPILLYPLYAWVADQADEYLGFMKTLISLNDLLGAAAKSAEEQEKAGKRKSKRVSISEAAIKNIQLTPEGAKSTDDFKSQFEKLTPMRVIYSGAEQLKIANDILIIINKQAEFSQIVTGFWDRAIEAAEKKDTGLSEPWFFGYSFVPPRKSGSRNIIEKIPPNVWLSQLYEFIKVHMDWTEDDDGGGGGEGGGGGGGGDGGDAYGGGGGGGDGNEPYTTEEEMVAQWPDIFKEGQTHEESAAAAAATKGGGKKGGNKFPFKDDEIIRTYVGIVLVTMDLVAESDAVDRTHLDNEMRKGLSTFLGGDIAVDNAIAAVNYAFTQDPASAAPAAAAINEPQASGNIQIVEGGIISPTFYNQLKRLNLEVGNGVDLLQYLRQNILKVSSDPALPGDEINIQPMVKSLQKQVKTSLEAYGFTAAAATTPPRVGTPTPRAAAAPPPPQPPKSVQPFSKQAPAESTLFQKPAEKGVASQTTVTDLWGDSGSESEDDGAGIARPAPRLPPPVRAGKVGGKRKKKRTRRRKPKKRRKRSKKKRKPKKKQTRRGKPKKKRTRRHKPKKKRTRRRKPKKKRTRRRRR